MKYKITLFMSKFMRVGEEYQTVDVSGEFVLDWDGVQNLLGYMIEGSKGKALKFEIQAIMEEK